MHVNLWDWFQHVLRHRSGRALRHPRFERLQDATTAHFRLRRCKEQRGEVPVHFATFTTAIYHWQDLAAVLRDYEEGTKRYREGRSDPLEPGEDKVPEDKRRVVQLSGVVA